MEMTLEKKKQLLAQFGPQCGNGNCEGPPKCLLKHSKQSKQSKDTKYYGLRKGARSRSSSMLEGSENNDPISNQQEGNRPRSNSSSSSANAQADFEDDLQLGLAISASEQTALSNVKMAEEAEVSRTNEISVGEKDDITNVEDAESDVKCKAEVDKAEEAVMELAVAKSLEERCTFCDKIFPSVDEVQEHVLQSHSDGQEGKKET